MNIFLSDRFLTRCSKSNCKIIFTLFFYLMFILSCTKNVEGSTSPAAFNDIVYTDSFSPLSYENPLSRKVITPEDIDIGILVSPETSDPDYRAIYTFVNNLFTQVFSGGKKSQFFSNASYNSYRLRYNISSKLKGKFILRLARPEFSRVEPFWVSYKLILKDKTIVGKIELTPSENSFTISDFEYKGFDDLFTEDKKSIK